MNKLIYGFEINRLTDDCESRLNMFFFSTTHNLRINHTSKGSNYIEKLDISKITQINFGTNRGNFSKLPKSILTLYNSDLCLSILINTFTLDLIFINLEDLNDFCYAITFMWEGEKDESKNTYLYYKNSVKYKNFKDVWNKYDTDFSGKMELNEFIEFAKEVKLKVDKLCLDQIFTKIDTDNSGKIEFEEFVTYFEEVTSCKEFQDDFNKYRGEKGYLNVNELKLFFKEIQNEENFGIYDAIHLILTYNKTIPKDLYNKIEDKLEK